MLHFSIAYIKNNSSIGSLYHFRSISEIIKKSATSAIHKAPRYAGPSVLYRFTCLKRSGLFYDRVGFSDNNFRY
jgi:hypothetical protein